jgi:hypothetical protein
VESSVIGQASQRKNGSLSSYEAQTAISVSAPRDTDSSRGLDARLRLITLLSWISTRFAISLEFFSLSRNDDRTALSRVGTRENADMRDIGAPRNNLSAAD